MIPHTAVRFRPLVQISPVSMCTHLCSYRHPCICHCHRRVQPSPCRRLLDKWWRKMSLVDTIFLCGHWSKDLAAGGALALPALVTLWFHVGDTVVSRVAVLKATVFDRCSHVVFQSPPSL